MITRILRLSAALTAVVLLFAAWIPGTASADGESEARDALYGTFETVRAIALPLGVVGIAASAIEMAGSDTTAAVRAKNRIIIILLAEAAIFLIPLILSMGAETVAQGVWDPEHPG